mmetsp:Transcript_4816/g.8258  ORF Transcript_4816/g.8258 Transcript_4816/m.8258 type:complete len:207 (-) Transcript_4816:1176-1796(-)
MKPSDNLVPYVLASMHPLLHMTLLITSLVLVSLDHEKFYEVPGTCTEKQKDAFYFLNEGKYWYMFYIMSSHLISILFHYLSQALNHFDFKATSKLFLVLKVFIYLYAVMKVQTGITYTECSEVTDKSHVMAWLTYEVVAFYLNIVSVAAFLFVASFKRYLTIKERLGFGGNMREHMDFLTYCFEDLHWWQMWFTQVMLFCLGLLFR